MEESTFMGLHPAVQAVAIVMSGVVASFFFIGVFQIRLPSFKRVICKCKCKNSE